MLDDACACWMMCMLAGWKHVCLHMCVSLTSLRGYVCACMQEVFRSYGLVREEATWQDTTMLTRMAPHLVAARCVPHASRKQAC